MPDKKQGCEHHGIVPVVDPAGAAAFVLHEPALEGTEEQNADQVAHGINAAEQNHHSIVQNAYHMQASEDAIENDPDQGNEHGGVVVMGYDFRCSGFDIISRKLFLTAGTFVFRWDKTKDHFQHKYEPYYHQDDGLLLQKFRDISPILHPEGDISE